MTTPTRHQALQPVALLDLLSGFSPRLPMENGGEDQLSKPQRAKAAEFLGAASARSAAGVIQLLFRGEGKARLVQLSEVRPDYLKFDMGLTRLIHLATPDRQKVVSAIVKMVNELGIVSLAEGVETIEDHHILAEMGFQLGQGFYYGRPAPISKYCPR